MQVTGMHSGAGQLQPAGRIAALAAVALSGLAFQATGASAKPICGIEYESPSQVQEKVELEKGLTGNTSDPNFVIYYDGNENLSWAFSTAANPVHPAVVCRRMEQKEGKFDIVMDIRCNAAKLLCDELYENFTALNRITEKKLNSSQPPQ